MEFRVPMLDSDGMIERDVIPPGGGLPDGGSIGQILTRSAAGAEWAPAPGGGGEREWSWYFPGLVQVEASRAVMYSPPLSVRASRIALLSLALSLGTPHNSAAPLSVRLLANGAEIRQANLQGGQAYANFDMPAPPATYAHGTAFSIAIASVDTSASVPASDLIVTAWWR